MPHVFSACWWFSSCSRKGSHAARSAARSSKNSRYRRSCFKLPRLLPERLLPSKKAVVATCLSAKLAGTPAGSGKPGPTMPKAVPLTWSTGRGFEAFLFLGRLHRMARSTTEGWLRKHSDNAFSPWRRRYFSLRGDKLEWYKPQGGEQEEKAAAASGSFTVTNDTAITAIEDNCIRLSKGQRSLVLMAGSAEEAQKWRVALTRRSGGTSTRASVVARPDRLAELLPQMPAKEMPRGGKPLLALPWRRRHHAKAPSCRVVAQGSTRRSRADSEPPQQPWLPTRLAAQGADHIVDRAVMAVNPAYLAERVVEQVNVDRIVEQINVDGIVDRVNVDRIVDRPAR